MKQHQAVMTPATDLHVTAETIAYRHHGVHLDQISADTQEGKCLLHRIFATASYVLDALNDGGR